MTQYELMLLLELDAGCYHACMCGRSGKDKTFALYTFDNLIERGFIELVGDEYFLTIDGKDAIDAAMIGISNIQHSFVNGLQQIGPVV